MEDYIKNMKSTVIIEKAMFNIITSDLVGLGDCGLMKGHNKLSFSGAAAIIQKFDKALPSVSKRLFKRVKATRNQICFSFGPDMEEYLNNN